MNRLGLANNSSNYLQILREMGELHAQVMSLSVLEKCNGLIIIIIIIV